MDQTKMIESFEKSEFDEEPIRRGLYWCHVITLFSWNHSLTQDKEMNPICYKFLDLTNNISENKENRKVMKQLTIVVGIAQRPGLIRVKVCVSSVASAREIGVGKETPLSIKRRAVTMETRGKEDDNVRLLTLVFDLQVRQLLSRITEEQSGLSISIFS